MTIIRRKMAHPMREDGAAERAVRIALPRAALETAGLDLTVASVAVEVLGAAELPRRVPDLGLIVTLLGQDGARGLAVLAPDVTAALVEMQMTGRLAAQSDPRRPTRTDAALARGFVDRALLALAVGLSPRTWATGFQCEVSLVDADALALALPEMEMRLLTVDVALAGGRGGRVLLAFPPAPAEEADPDNGDFGTGLADRVLGTEAIMEAILCRMTVPLSAVLHLKVGDAIPLPSASVDQVRFETQAGVTIAQGRLGQNKGMRAIRLVPATEATGEVALLKNAG